MATNVQDITRSLGAFDLGSDVAQGHDQVSGLRNSDQPTNEQLIQALSRSADITLSHCQSVNTSLVDRGLTDSLGLAELCALRKNSTDLTTIALSLNNTATQINEAIETSIIAHLESLGNLDRGGYYSMFHLQELLGHFDGQIRKIIRDIFSETSDERCVLWQVAEECYNQATGPHGVLDADEYVVPQEDACIGRIYDLDYESEHFFDQEERPEICQTLEEYLDEEAERKREIESKKRQDWIGFWVEVLHGCPDGPTLFYPPASRTIEMPTNHLTDTPPYLFRTFDRDSSGINDDDVIASMASDLTPERSRNDFLSLEKHEATELLYSHLNKSCFEGLGSDNLMSWTSSLLFAIQYAIWRCHIRQCSQADVKICVVDTSKYPRGQFARDMWLIKAYRATAEEMVGDYKNFFDFRYTNSDYYNGEFLSQGRVNHAGRSCVVTLETLIDSGLYKIYPEFAEPYGMLKWPKRVLELRIRWQFDHQTTLGEVESAFDLAKRSFPSLALSDMVLMLLMFKKRIYRKILLEEEEKQNVSEFDRTPVEVQRFLVATRAMDLLDQDRGFYNAEMMVQALFECT
ncbi:hypothetical protein F4805DRAFT_463829 [Annulohypoxylon moriforme]|nr:hypothetical protein F4805DRAFT_463829 [Annulohypoxylon moriforme]